MNLSDAQRARLEERLKAKLTPGCQACGRLASPRIAHDSTVYCLLESLRQLHGNVLALPVICALCDNCGHMRLFAVGVLDPEGFAKGDYGDAKAP